MMRSIGAVVLGFVLIGVLSVSGDMVLRAVMPGAFSAEGAVGSTPDLQRPSGSLTQRRRDAGEENNE